MIFSTCFALTIASALVATFVGDVRRAVLALWITGIGVGGLYLSIGAELLAIMQWIVSTLVAIAFIFYTVMYGEFGAPDPRSISKRVSQAVLPVVVGATFAVIVWIGGRSLDVMTSFGPSAPPQADQGLAVVGKRLSQEKFLSLDVLALTLFLVVVGSGVIARTETSESGAKEQS